MKIAIINGPNLNLLGTREPDVYGKSSFESYFAALSSKYSHIQLSYYQSNIEGGIIDYLHQLIKDGIDAILINAGAYTHTSIAIADAIAAIKIPTIEIHISNIMAREEFRKTSYISSKCVGSISGLGLESYELGIQYFILKAAE
ncbi:MAG: type II 3-dehydroquinate dehydratase [Phycisphaerales bacterium]|nr:type II 3-dehydroquinate dehydratase [Phycisphaerales bacterium]